MKDLAIFELQPDSSYLIRFPRSSVMLKNNEVYHQTMLMMIGNIVARLRNNEIKGDDTKDIVATWIMAISAYIRKLQDENGVGEDDGIKSVRLKSFTIDSSRAINMQIEVDGNVFNV